MNGRTHVFYGFGLVALVCAVLLWFAYGDANYDYPSLLMIGVGGTFGALFPDFDLIFGIRHHRNTLTHSALLPVAVTIAYAFTPSVDARTLLMFVSIGMMTHFLFDLFVSNVEGNIVTRWGRRLYLFAKGKVGGSFKGSGAKWANKHERAYLLIHAGLCIVCAVVLFWGIYNSIVVVGWFW